MALFYFWILLNKGWFSTGGSLSKTSRNLITINNINEFKIAIIGNRRGNSLIVKIYNHHSITYFTEYLLVTRPIKKMN